MADEAGTVWISFNGEIFNYVELRAELRERGHHFRTASDTEVIVHAWKEWGPAAFERFNGQWAIALWEPQSERLILSRDRLGRTSALRRPHTVGACCSHPRSRPCSPTPPSIVRSTRPASTRCSRSGARSRHARCSPGSARFRPATISSSMPMASTPRRTGRCVSRRLAPSPRRISYDNAERLRELVETAARLRFERSDVPVGAYLSGGLDSSVTTSVVAVSDLGAAPDVLAAVRRH